MIKSEASVGRGSENKRTSSHANAITPYVYNECPRPAYVQAAASNEHLRNKESKRACFLPIRSPLNVTVGMTATCKHHREKCDVHNAASTVNPSPAIES